MKTSIKIISRSFLYLVIGIGFFASRAFAQGDGHKLSTSTLKIFIEYRLAKDNLLNENNINVEIKGNKIILSGTVPTIYDKKEAEEESRNVDENYFVINNLKVEGSGIPDSVVAQNVLKKIHNNVFYGVFDWVTLRYNNGVATLKGWVHLPWLKSQFQSEAEKVAGVKEVKNEIKNTFGPGNIGIKAALLIYNDPEFEGMEYLADPPVHIIVNNGTVFLEGHVLSRAQSSWADNIVRFRTDAFTVNNNLKIKGS